MKKFYINITLIIIILGLIVYGVIFINKYRNELKINNVFLDNKGIEINLNEIIGEGFSVKYATKIDDKSTIVLIANKNDNGEKIESKVIFYDIYSHREKADPLIYDTNIEVIGIDEKIYIGVKDKNLDDYTSIDVVLKNNYSIEKNIEIQKKLEIHQLMVDDNRILFTNNDGLFYCNHDFKEINKIFNSKQINADITLSENYIPISFYLENEIIYKRVGDEWSCGIGKYNLDTKEDVFYEQFDTEYLGGIQKDNQAYLFNSFSVFPISKLDFNTLTNEVVIENELSDFQAIFPIISDNTIAYINEKITTEGTKERQAVIFNTITKEQTIKKVNIEGNNNTVNGIVSNIIINNNLVVVSNNKIILFYK